MTQRGTPWVDGLTIGEVLRRTAARHGERDALVFPALDYRLSWGELDARVDMIASGLLQLGIGAGEHVGIWSMNCPEWVLLQFAVGRIGSVLVNINPAYRLHELEDALRAADVSSLVVGLPYKTSDYVTMTESIVPELALASSPTGWRSARLPALERVIAIGEATRPSWYSWSQLEAREPHAELPARSGGARHDEVYNIQFTSGTTGLPKGAMLTHRNVLMNAYYIGERVAYTERDRVCVPVPFYHCFGCVLGTTVCVVYGSAIVAPAPRFDPKATLEAIERERCTSIYGVPTMFTGQLDHPDFGEYDLSSLRTGIMAGAPCPVPLMRRVVNDMGAREITIGYGLTEASPIITQTSVDDTIDVRTSTVGRPIPGAEVRLVNPVTHAPASGAEPGELCVRSHGVMAGYYKAPEATARAIDGDGWLHTGDLAVRLEDGNYKIVGRSKELIIRGGENIYPPEIEEYLCHHPAISECAVVGLPDSVYGEEVSAWIVLRPRQSLTAEEVRGYCKDQIAHYKIPRYMVFEAELPRTVTGKVKKFELRERGIERFGLGEASATPTA
jgi:fatty-acyl-CoA synthase